MQVISDKDAQTVRREFGTMDDKSFVDAGLSFLNKVMDGITAEGEFSISPRAAVALAAVD